MKEGDVLMYFFFFFFPWKNSVIAVSSSQFFSTSCLFYGLEVTTLARFQGYLFVKLHSSIFKRCIYKKKNSQVKCNVPR